MIGSARDVARAREDWLFRCAFDTAWQLAPARTSLRAAARNLHDPEMTFTIVGRLVAVVVERTNWSANGLDPGEPARLEARWLAFIDANEARRRQGSAPTTPASPPTSSRGCSSTSAPAARGRRGEPAQLARRDPREGDRAQRVRVGLVLVLLEVQFGDQPPLEAPVHRQHRGEVGGQVGRGAARRRRAGSGGPAARASPSTVRRW